MISSDIEDEKKLAAKVTIHSVWITSVSMKDQPVLTMSRQAISQDRLYEGHKSWAMGFIISIPISFSTHWFIACGGGDHGGGGSGDHKRKSGLYSIRNQLQPVDVVRVELQ